MIQRTYDVHPKEEQPFSKSKQKKLEHIDWKY